MSTMKIELNGTLITGRIDGVESFSVTIRRSDESGRLAKSFSSELTFYDDGYQILKTILIDDPTGFSKKVAIKIYDDCCKGNPVFDGFIFGDAIDWCEPGCFITANVVEDDAQINCIKSTIIWDDWNGFSSVKQHPIIRYCIESRPEFFQYVLVFLTAILNYIFFGILIGILTTLIPIIAIIYVICQVIDFICDIPLIGCNSPNCNTPFTNPVTLINNVFQIYNQLNELLIPCGRFHPSPYVRDYIKNVCDKCGLNFQSSILNNPSSLYYNLVMTSAQIKKGRAKNSTNYSVIDDNRPVETLETYLNQYLKPIFNADYRVANGVLTFERKDYFNTNVNWIDTEQLLNQGDIVDDTICFNWIDKERFSFGRFEYQLDAQDYIGNEAKSRYNDIIDWNVPYNSSQAGEYTLSIPASPARHREDGIDTDVFTFMENALGGIINVLFGGAFSSYDKVLLINQHTFFNYKFLIYNPISNGEVQNNYSDTFIGGSIYIPPDERFNYPMWFWEGRQNNLYSLFHYIDDPRLPGATNFEFKFTFRFDCTQYNSFSFEKTIRLVKGGNVVNGLVNELSIDFKNRTIQVSGIV